MAKHTHNTQGHCSCGATFCTDCGHTCDVSGRSFNREMLMKRKILSVLGTAAMAIGLIAIPAQADSDTVITVTIKNQPDNGYGKPSHWADTTFVRTVIVHPVDDKFSVTVKDSGTLVTRKNAGSPNNGVPIARKLPGTYTSTVNYGLVTGELDGNQVGDIDGNVYDHKTGNKPPKTGEWSKLLFEPGATGGAITTYQFLYQTLDETWDETTENNDGQDESAGDITGILRSKLTAVTKCRISKTDKRNIWLVKNVKGDRTRTFNYWLKKADGSYVKGNKPVTVNPDESASITTPAGGRLTVRYWDGYGVEKRIYTYSNYGKTKVVC